MARANRTSSAISTNSPSGGTAGGIPGRRSTTCSAWSPACRTPPCETSSTSGSEQRLPSNAATNPSRREHGRPDRPRHRRGRWRRLPGCPCQVSATGIGSAAAAGEPYRGDDRRGTPGGLVRRRLGHQQPQRLQARGEGDARRLGGQKGMIKTGRRSGADDSATISTHCVTGTNGRSLVGSIMVDIDALMPLEVAALLDRDTRSFVEFSSVILRKAGGWAEWIATQAFGLEIAIEQLGELRVDPELRLESRRLLAGDVQLHFELLATPGSEALLDLESLMSGAHIAADGPFCLEWANLSSVLVLTSERLLRSPGRVRILAGPGSVHPLRGQ